MGRLTGYNHGIVIIVIFSHSEIYLNRSNSIFVDMTP